MYYFLLNAASEQFISVVYSEDDRSSSAVCNRARKVIHETNEKICDYQKLNESGRNNILTRIDEVIRELEQVFRYEHHYSYYYHSLASSLKAKIYQLEGRKTEEVEAAYRDSIRKLEASGTLNNRNFLPRNSYYIYLGLGNLHANIFLIDKKRFKDNFKSSEKYYMQACEYCEEAYQDIAVSLISCNDIYVAFLADCSEENEKEIYMSKIYENFKKIKNWKSVSQKAIMSEQVAETFKSHKDYHVFSKRIKDDGKSASFIDERFSIDDLDYYKERSSSIDECAKLFDCGFVIDSILLSMKSLKDFHFYNHLANVHSDLLRKSKYIPIDGKSESKISFVDIDKNEKDVKISMLLQTVYLYMNAFHLINTSNEAEKKRIQNQIVEKICSIIPKDTFNVGFWTNKAKEVLTDKSHLGDPLNLTQNDRLEKSIVSYEISLIIYSTDVKGGLLNLNAWSTSRTYDRFSILNSIWELLFLLGKYEDSYNVYYSRYNFFLELVLDNLRCFNNIGFSRLLLYFKSSEKQKAKISLEAPESFFSLGKSASLLEQKVSEIGYAILKLKNLNDWPREVEKFLDGNLDENFLDKSACWVFYYRCFLLCYNINCFNVLNTFIEKKLIAHSSDDYTKKITDYIGSLNEKVSKEIFEKEKNFVSNILERDNFFLFLDQLRVLMKLSCNIRTPKCFISYAWYKEQEKLKELQTWIKDFKNHLEAVGVTVFYDSFDMKDDMKETMDNNIRDSDIIFVVGTEYFKKKVEESFSDKNNLQFEQICIHNHKKKVIPLVWRGDFARSLPDFLHKSADPNDKVDLNYKGHLSYVFTEHNYHKLMVDLDSPFGIFPAFLGLKKETPEYEMYSKLLEQYKRNSSVSSYAEWKSSINELYVEKKSKNEVSETEDKLTPENTEFLRLFKPNLSLDRIITSTVSLRATPP